MPEKDNVGQAALKISSSFYPIALTGAGISVESGIPDFRGKDGLWSKYDPLEYAHIEGFLRDPDKIWNMLAELISIVRQAEPNPAHYALATLEKKEKLRCVVTQNIDGLHQRAGSKNVFEFHGSNDWLLCIRCLKKFPTASVSLETIPPRCECGQALKPDVVFFGEMIPQRALKGAFEAASVCDLLLVIGTSAEVVPASQLAYVAKSNGATIIEINPEESNLTNRITDIHIPGKAGEILPLIIDRIFQGERMHG